MWEMIASVLGFVISTIVYLRKIKRAYIRSDELMRKAIERCVYYETFALSGEEKKKKVLADLGEMSKTDEILISNLIDYIVSVSKKINVR